MKIYVDSPQILDIQKGKRKAVSFNVIRWFDREHFDVQKGYRIMGGLLTPPHTQIGRQYTRYVQTSFVSPAEAKGIYDAVKASGWPELAETEPLYPAAFACRSLVITDITAAAISPKLVELMAEEDVTAADQLELEMAGV